MVTFPLVSARHAAEEAVTADPTNLELEQASRSARGKGHEEAIAASKKGPYKGTGGGALAPQP